MIWILLQKYAAKEFNYSHDLLKWAGKHPSSERLFIEEAANILPIKLAREICGHRMWKMAATGWMEVCLQITFWQMREKTVLARHSHSPVWVCSFFPNPEQKHLSLQTAVLRLVLSMPWSSSIFIRTGEAGRLIFSWGSWVTHWHHQHQQQGRILCLSASLTILQWEISTATAVMLAERTCSSGCSFISVPYADACSKSR